ncbi:MAG: hypothetical protein M3Q45_13245, partial [Chloroflexota bacterium]|nr:hypothetical protein [Chloroflexota bacterium]
GFDRTVYKSFSAQEHAWHETPVCASRTLAQLDKVCYAPVIFQERIPAQTDLRIVVVGKTLFTVAVQPHAASHTIDHPVGHRLAVGRMHGEAFELPAEIATGVQTLMQRLELIYGVVDMRLTPDGEYIFREVDPSGAWLWLEECSGLPITQTFAHYLAGCATGRRENELHSTFSA